MVGSLRCLNSIAFHRSFSYHSSCSLKDSQWNKWVPFGTQEAYICPHHFFTWSFWEHAAAARTPLAEGVPVLHTWPDCFLRGFLHPSLPVPAPSSRNKMPTEDFYLLSPYNFLFHIVYIVFPGEIIAISISWLSRLIRNRATKHSYFTLISIIVFWHWFSLHFDVLGTILLENTNWYKWCKSV